MDVLDAIHRRRTVKQFRPEPVPRETLERLFEAARWAPNHRLTEPWRYRVLGPQSLEQLKVVAGPGGGKLHIAPTLVTVSYVPSPLPAHATEDAHATAAATYGLLLAATAEGLDSFWRTPGFLDTPEGRAAVGMPDEERVLGLICLGHAEDDAEGGTDERKGLEHFVTWLD